MIISHSKKFIFIHIYKVAGTSIETALLKYNNESFFSSSYGDMLKFITGEYPWAFGTVTKWGHQTATELKETIPKNAFDNYFKFAFVRNPYDWQVSLYHYMKQDPLHKQYSMTGHMDFNEYIKWRVREDLHLQKEFIYDDKGKLMIDYVGKYEQLQGHFDTVCDYVGINRIQLERLNTSNHLPYESIYNSESEEIVYNAFKEDFELFGYERMRIEH